MAFKTVGRYDDDENYTGVINFGAMANKALTEKFDERIKWVRGMDRAKRVETAQVCLAFIVETVQEVITDRDYFSDWLFTFFACVNELACAGLDLVPYTKKKELAEMLSLFGDEDEWVKKDMLFDWKQFRDKDHQMLVHTFLGICKNPELHQYPDTVANYLLVACCADRPNENGIKAARYVWTEYLEYVRRVNRDPNYEYTGTYNRAHFQNELMQKQHEEERRIQEEAERKQREAEIEKKRKEEEIRCKREAEEAARREKAQEEKNKRDAIIAEKKRKYQPLVRGMICARGDNFVCTTEAWEPRAFVKYNTYGKGAPGNISAFKNIKSIVVTYDGIVGLRTDGTCIATDPGFTYSFIQECNAWKNIQQIAAGEHHVVGLCKDETCVANRVEWNTGYGYRGQCDVSSWYDITSIACGDDFTIGLKKDGTVVCAGEAAKSVSDWKDVVLIGAGGDGAVGITKDGKILSAGKVRTEKIRNAKNVVDLMICRGDAYALLADGTVLGDGCEKLKNVVAMTCGYGTKYFLKKDGTIEKKKSFGSDRVEIPSDLVLFKSYDALIEREENKEKAEREKKRKEAEERAARIAQQAAYRESGVCQHCGGEFKKSLFGVKCVACRTRKDY